jgi:hypothetical protein
MKGSRVTTKKLMRLDHFNKVFKDELPKALAFTCEIDAQVWSTEHDGLEVDIISVTTDPLRLEVSCFLTSEAENELIQLMRTEYINEALKGLEGDAHNGGPDEAA